MSKKPSFWHLIPLNPRIKIFFKIPVVSLFLLHWSLTSCKVSEKLNERSRRTNGQTNGQGRLLWTPSGKHGVQNIFIYPFCIKHKCRSSIMTIYKLPWLRQSQNYQCENVWLSSKLPHYNADNKKSIFTLKTLNLRLAYGDVERLGIIWDPLDA